jgi:F0F1-type ATP synthase alpha subunit
VENILATEPTESKQPEMDSSSGKSPTVPSTGLNSFQSINEKAVTIMNDYKQSLTSIDSVNDYKNIGKITGIKNNIVEVQFDLNKPDIGDVLNCIHDDNVQLEVFASSSDSIFFCLSLTSPQLLHRGLKVYNSQEKLSIPIGPELLGRALDLFGNPQDGKGPLLSSKKLSVQRFTPKAFEKL